MQPHMNFLTCYLSQGINFRVLAKWWFETLSKEDEKSKTVTWRTKRKQKTPCVLQIYISFILFSSSQIVTWLLCFYSFIFYLVICEIRFLNIFMFRKYYFIGRWKCFWVISFMLHFKGSLIKRTSRIFIYYYMIRGDQKFALEYIISYSAI